MKKKDLDRQVDRVLIDGLPESLKQQIDGALAAGAEPRTILGRVHRLAPRRVTFTALAVEAYLESKTGAKLAPDNTED